MYSDLYPRAHRKYCFSACCLQSAKGSPLDEASKELPSRYQLTLSSRIEASASHSGKHFVTDPGAVPTIDPPQSTENCSSSMLPQLYPLPSTLSFSSVLKLPHPSLTGISPKTHPSDRQQGSGPTVHLIISSEIKRLRDGERGEDSVGESIAR